MDTSNKHIWHITFPILMTVLTQNVVNVTNTAFLGRVGEIELGASAIGGVFYIAIFMISFGFSQGCQILIGRRNGEKNYVEIGKIFNNGLIFSISLALVFIALSEFLFTPLLSIIIKSEKIYHASVEYLNWRLLGLLFLFINVMFRAFYVGITKTKVLSISAIITAVVNIILDYVLIFGKFGFPALGIVGAAIASIIAEAATTVFLFIYTFQKANTKQYQLFIFKKIDFKVIKNTLDLSVYMMFQYFISVSTWFMFFIFIERTGERPLAVSNIIRSLYTVLMVPANALATTTSTMISNLIGEERKEEVIPLLKRMLRIDALVYIPFVLLLLFLPEPLARIYTSDINLINESIPVLRSISLALLVFGTGSLLFISVSATGNTRMAFIFEFTVLFFYISYTFITTIVLPSSVSVVWLSEYIYWGLVGLMSFFYLKYANWKKRSNGQNLG